MSRKFRISVNGKSYDVDVEELGAGAASAAPIAAPAAAPAPVKDATKLAAPKTDPPPVKGAAAIAPTPNAAHPKILNNPISKTSLYNLVFSLEIFIFLTFS